ncbi:TetR family transcriptional regulator [Amycolatopsis antarctica]|uniref:TetR family transcriptional regulator n=1 Tax=Amycolatopsis antarctica TaxID=1854586 RepID=A0A263D7K5_9PSEU|nr:TetR/AcrR family transcriptional regulator [Amycolatopsis antarctica]OZM74361.1 TetR family transcriptional regulator [Amycolatopsis antarctica]
MVTRAESAAVTRRALLDAAAELLDLGGPGAVTLREVGARAGVTRGAPYRHFADKDSLLTAVATESWERISDQVRALRIDPALPASEKLRGALRVLIGVGREQPHLYQVMCSAPAGDPTAAQRAAGRSQDEFREIVAALVGERDARHYGALLLAGAHGIAGMEVSGYLAADQWHTTADEVVDTLVRMVAGDTT